MNPLDAALGTLAQNPQAPLDLAEIALHLARDEYPFLDVEAHLAELSALAHEARRCLAGDRLGQVRGLCRYLFHDMGFHGNRRHDDDPDNSYLNVVMERRTGLPIALSAVTIAVGRRAGLPVEGVGLPGHFIVKVPGSADGDAPILLDPFHGGRLLTPADCVNLVRQATGVALEASALSLEALPLGPTVQRMLNNLKAIYRQREDWPRAVRVMERLRQLVPDDVPLRRDLGIAYLHHDRPGRAIDHLAAYLGSAADASDAATVRQVLHVARDRMAAWN